MAKPFAERVADRELTIGIVGLGYVGLPLAVEFAAAGFDVVGVDIDADRVERVNAGHSYLTDLTDEALAAVLPSGNGSAPGPAAGGVAVRAGTLRATTSFNALAEVDAISICVPTPLSKERSPDVSYILAAAEEIALRLRPGQLIVLESTTYPGTTRELVLARFQETGLTVGEGFFLVFSPERVDPGNPHFSFHNTPKVMGGITPACVERAALLYLTITDRVVRVSSTEAAEMTKLLENTFRSVNIALVNELAIMCNRLGLDVWEIIDAAATKPFGFMRFLPGPGLGGHCIPVDPLYLSWKLRQLNYTARFIELATEVNGEMPRHVVNRVTDALNARRQSVNGAAILVLGVAYKRDINDVRESPALAIIELLEEKGATVTYHDPYIPELMVDGVVWHSVALSAERLAAQDCVVLVTDHTDFNAGMLVEHSPLIVDTRHALGGIAADHVIRL
ncbi:MAG: nucleotide sugar dehydrogenase [Gemmatimonadota bacterium]